MKRYVKSADSTNISHKENTATQETTKKDSAYLFAEKIMKEQPVLMKLLERM